MRADRKGAQVEHASEQLIGDYARGGTELPADTVWALEAHLEGCAPCRGRLAASVSTGAPELTALLDTVRAGLEPELVTAPAPLRRRPGRASAWLTPAMAPWLAMTFAVTALALVLDRAGPPGLFGGVSPLLLLAPVLPLGAVAASWSSALDPAHELTATTARAGLPLLLRRTTAVLALVLPLLLLEGWLTGAMAAAQWLLPSLAFTSAALGLGTFVGVTRAAAALAGGWALAVLAPAAAVGHPLLVPGTDQLPLWVALLALGAAVITLRRNAYSTR
ncbi:zf-HC2 domain-containing protein [Kitasatospora sp. NPDC051853]|uniref:zf-HC2 domain-containing protein n=1 Tax=Kitasatospora sp. NPDC051853 TaxID=3364058 RepID=UPI00378FCF6A